MAIQELQEKRQSIANSIKELAKTQETWTAEDRASWVAINSDYDSNLALLNTENERIAASAAESAAVAARISGINDYENLPANRFIGKDGASLGDIHNKDRFGGQQDDGMGTAMAIQGWLRANSSDNCGPVTNEHISAAKRCGMNLNSKSFTLNLPTERPYSHYRAAALKEMGIRNALSGQHGTSGGFIYGDTFISQLEQAMLAFGGMFQVSDIMRTPNAEPLRWPTADDTSNTGIQIGESAAVTEADPTFGQIVWYAHKFSSKLVKVPSELLRDSVFNLSEKLAMMLGERLGRIQNTKFTTGTGAQTPKGITLCASAGVTAASATAIAFDEIIDLEHSLDPSRRSLPGVGYMFHDGILKAIRKLKDGNGAYLWQSGANSGAPDSLNGYPYQINQDMQSTVATATITMLFGQFSQYKIRQVNSIRLFHLMERYRDNDQDGFVAFMESDGTLLNAGDNPVKKLTQA